MGSRTTQKSVLILCGDYMEDLQVMVPFQALQAYGVSVHAVCPGKRAGDTCRTSVHQQCCHQTYSESRGHNFTLNATFDEVVASEYDGIIIPGGRAAEYLAMNDSVLNLVSKFSDFVKPIASTCHGQLILAAAGLLKGRRCTGPPPLKPVLLAAGAHWVEVEDDSSCVKDGNLITGSDYLWHDEFIRTFVKELGGSIVGLRKSILFLCGDYMEDYEVMVPLQCLKALNCDCKSACPNKKAGDICPTAIHDFEGDQTYSEKPGHDFTLSEDFESVVASSYNALVIPGGRAPEYLAVNEKVLAIVREFMAAQKPVASICHGQQILAAAGVLEGKICTAYPTVKLNVVLSGGLWLEPDPIDRCFTDANLVTGAAWPGHPEFVSQLMALLGIQVGHGVSVSNLSVVGGLLELLPWRERVATCQSGDRLGAVPWGPFLGIELPTQNWYGQGESDCLIKTKHCDGPCECWRNVNSVQCFECQSEEIQPCAGKRLE